MSVSTDWRGGDEDWLTGAKSMNDQRPVGQTIKGAEPHVSSPALTYIQERHQLSLSKKKQTKKEKPSKD